MAKIDLYSIKGVKSGELTLPEEMSGEPNMNLLAQAVRVYEERGHVGLRHTKTRSEVNRTTKKLYKQKGTGGARHGSRRANVFVGGGITFGPRAVRRELSLSDALRAKAKLAAFAAKLKDKSIVALEDLGKVEKTKVAGEFLKKLAVETKARRFTFLLADKNLATIRALRNLGNAEALSFKVANAFNVFTGGMLVLDAGIFESEKKAEKSAKKTAAKTK